MQINIVKIILPFILLFNISHAQENINNQLNTDCYTIIVGKNASFDGSVLIGHNEDDSGEKMLVNWIKVGKKNNSENSKIKLVNGIEIDQVTKTYSYIWLQVTKQKFADAFVNENSVLVCSDACLSKEDTAIGNIGYYLRRIIAERAKSSKHAVMIAGEFVEKYGYESSGRTYCIADKNEAWMMSIVKGKRWIAQRIPDDQVAIIPNYYTIQEIELTDTLNFLSSPDIITYAEERDWYKEEARKTFNFREIYGNPFTNISISNIPRHLSGINALSEKQYYYGEKIPFSFIPKNKVSLEDIQSILSNHYEGSEFEVNPAYNNGNPHEHTIARICNNNTQFSFIAQLRNNLPNEIGTLLWLSPYNGCIYPYIPVYFGIKDFPDAFKLPTITEAQKLQFENEKNNLKNFKLHAYYDLSEYIDYIEANYGIRIIEAKKFKNIIENELRVNQKKLEESVLQVYNSYPDDAKKILNEYCKGYMDRLLKFSKTNR